MILRHTGTTSTSRMTSMGDQTTYATDGPRLDAARAVVALG